MPASRPSRPGPANSPGRSIRRGGAPSALDPPRPAATLPQARSRCRQKSAGRKIRTAPWAGLNPTRSTSKQKERKKRRRKRKRKKPASKPRGRRDSAPSRARPAILPKTRGAFANGGRRPRRERPGAAGSSARGRAPRTKREKGGEKVERTGKIAPAAGGAAATSLVRRAVLVRPTARGWRRETGKGKQGRPTADGRSPRRPGRTETPQSGRGNKKRSGFHRSFSQAGPDRVPRMGRPGDARLNLLCKRFPLQQTSGPRHEAKARARP